MVLGWWERASCWLLLWPEEKQDCQVHNSHLRCAKAPSEVTEVSQPVLEQYKALHDSTLRKMHPWPIWNLFLFSWLSLEMETGGCWQQHSVFITSFKINTWYFVGINTCLEHLTLTLHKCYAETNQTPPWALHHLSFLSAHSFNI